MTSENKPSETQHLDISSRRIALGIDIGGSGIKGGLVDLDKGELIADRYRIVTPQPSTPTAVSLTVKEIVDHFDWDGPIGVAIPSVVSKGITKTASNIDHSWIGLDADTLLSTVLERKAHIINDADAAGLAEIAFGAAKDFPGTALLLTLGTGIGSAIITNGCLYPNSELGHLMIGSKPAEKRAASSIREREKLSYEEWAHRVTKVLTVYETILSPDLVIIGGGISKKSDKWLHFVDIKTPVITAHFHNEAGIIGAAILTDQHPGE